MSVNVEHRNLRPYVHIGWAGIALFTFGIGLLLGTFGGVFDLYDQIEPLLNSGVITEEQGKAVSSVQESTKSVMVFSVILSLLGVLTAAWAAVTYARRSKS